MNTWRHEELSRVLVLCVGVHPRVCYIHMHAHMWRPEVNIGCCTPGTVHLGSLSPEDLYVYVHESVGALGGQKRALIPCELPVWILGIELCYSARVVHTRSN